MCTPPHILYILYSSHTIRHSASAEWLKLSRRGLDQDISTQTSWKNELAAGSGVVGPAVGDFPSSQINSDASSQRLGKLLKHTPSFRLLFSVIVKVPMTVIAKSR